MSPLLSLLALLGGAAAVSAIGTRFSLYFYRQDVLEVHPRLAHRASASPSAAPFPCERSSTGDLGDSRSTSTRYARICLGIIACVVLLAILVIAGLLSGMAL